jgi:plastocyanin
MKRTYILIAAIAMIAVVAVAIFAFGGFGSQPLPSPSPTRSPSLVVVEMVDSDFVPTQLTITAGTTVEWVNHGAQNHTTTNYAGTMGPMLAWNSGNLQPGQTFNYTFTEVGTFKYRCNLNPTTMLAKIIVNP